MAKKSVKAAESTATTVTRVVAKDDKNTSPKKPTQKVTSDQSERKRNIFRKFFGYFKGAWFELRQVRWPNRRATWSMTIALLIFSGVFGAFILLVDLGWEYLFKLLIG